MVTVIVPAYNHEKYVIECLESIHHQTYRNFQWIVVDDCSKDKTPEILKDNQSKYGYQLILHEKNVGISETLTEVIINYAKGKYITICASDDVFLPNKIEAQLNYMEAHPQYGMCYSRSLYIDEESKPSSYRDNYIFKSGHIFKEVLCRDFFIGICTMFKTDVVKEVGCFKKGVVAEDYYIHSLIAQKYEIGFLDLYLNKYRVVELSKKRDPWGLMMSHRQTVDMFKESEIYKKAVRAWEINTIKTISMYTKHKRKIIKYFIKNMDYFVLHPIEGLYVVGYLLLVWK